MLAPSGVLAEDPLHRVRHGAGCDGQVLVYHDLLGLEERIAPRFVRRYAQLGTTGREAVAACSRAAIFRACMGSTRVSLSAVASRTAG